MVIEITGAITFAPDVLETEKDEMVLLRVAQPAVQGALPESLPVIVLKPRLVALAKILRQGEVVEVRGPTSRISNLDGHSCRILAVLAESLVVTRPH